MPGIEFEQGSADWQARYARSKFTDRPAYGTLLRGHIGLQDHWDKVWFRDIRVRAPGAEAGAAPRTQ